MASVDITAKDRERFARARALGTSRSESASAIIEAQYDARRDAIELTFCGGGTMMIPREFIPGLEHASAAALATISLSPAGDAISWRSLDIDVYVPGLVERAFGTRLFAASTGQRGGRRRSKSKAETARANGSRGGRPRKPVAV